MELFHDSCPVIGQVDKVTIETREPDPYKECFYVAKEMTKVNVKENSRCGDHDVVVMAISYALIW